jgi:hypothetical protein
MTGTARLRQVTLAVAVMALLVGLPAEAGHSGGSDQFRIRSSVAFSTTGVIASGAGEALDIRLQRDTRAEKGQRSVRQDGLTRPASPGRRPQAWAAALAAVLERSGHPERIGHILLRASGFVELIQSTTLASGGHPKEEVLCTWTPWLSWRASAAPNSPRSSVGWSSF